MSNQYMHRQGPGQNSTTSFFKMINQYPKDHNIHYFLIVEGESDEKFFKKFIDNNVCAVKSISRNNENSNKQKVIDFIKKENKNYYLGIIDADFDHILNNTPDNDNLIMTDFHDIEMLILNCHHDMSYIYAELADTILITEFEKNGPKSFIDSIIDIAFEIGILRFVCFNKDNYSRLSTKDLEFSDCIKYMDKKFKIDMKMLIKRVINSNSRKSPSEYDINNSISRIKDKSYDKYQICCGHDVTKILELCFRSDDGLGFGDVKYLNTSRIESLLRTACTSEDFKTTALYKSILQWGKNRDLNIFKSSLFAN